MKDMVLIMSDQHGWDYTGFADERIETPGLKKVAEEGLLFERCYCNSPLCVPSRMISLLKIRIEHSKAHSQKNKGQNENAKSRFFIFHVCPAVQYDRQPEPESDQHFSQFSNDVRS